MGGGGGGFLGSILKPVTQPIESVGNLIKNPSLDNVGKLVTDPLHAIGDAVTGTMNAGKAPDLAAPGAPDAPATPDSGAVTDAADKVRKAGAGGKASTMLTGGSGLLDDPTTARKTLLGS